MSSGPDGKPMDVPEVKVAFTLKAKDIGPLPVVPDRIATGHWSGERGPDPDGRRVEDRGDRADLRHRPDDRRQERADRLNAPWLTSPPEHDPVERRRAGSRGDPAGADRASRGGGCSAPPAPTGLVLGAAGGAAGYAAGAGRRRRPRWPPSAPTGDRFHGETPAGHHHALQARGHLVAFDLAPGAGRKEAAALLRRWSAHGRAADGGRGRRGDGRHGRRPGRRARPR